MDRTSNFKLKKYIIKKIEEADDEFCNAEDITAKLHFATERMTYARILNNYIGDDSHLCRSQIQMAETYLEAKSYDQAIKEIKMVERYGGPLSEETEEKLKLLMIRCVLEQEKYDDAKEIILELNPKFHEKEFYELRTEIMMNLNDQEKTRESFTELERIIKEVYTEDSVEYGLFLIKNGKAKGHFEDYGSAVKDMEAGMEILIEKRCKMKEEIGNFYLTIAYFYRKSEEYAKQYSNLICAQAMIRQLPCNEKRLIYMSHLLSTNLIKQEEYSKAFSQLKKAEQLQKQLYGESSQNVGKTQKKITRVLQEMKDFKEAKKYELEYKRILGGEWSESTRKKKLSEIDVNSLRNS